MSTFINYTRKSYKLYRFGKIPVTLNFNMDYGAFYSLLDINVGSLEHTSLKVSLWTRSTSSSFLSDYIASIDQGGLIIPTDGSGGLFSIAAYYKVKQGQISLGLMNASATTFIPVTPYSTGVLSYYIAYF